MMMKSLFVSMCLFFTIGCLDHIFTFEIPDRFTGWVTVEFGAASCHEAKTKIRTIIKVRGDGTACSSAHDYPKTALFSRFFYVKDGKRTAELRPTGWGKGGMIWAESTEMDGHEYRFFVGTEKQFNNRSH
jgi:hypothetical protein